MINKCKVNCSGNTNEIHGVIYLDPKILQSKIYLEGKKNECAFVYDYMIEIWHNIHNVRTCNNM